MTLCVKILVFQWVLKYVTVSRRSFVCVCVCVFEGCIQTSVSNPYDPKKISSRYFRGSV